MAPTREQGAWVSHPTRTPTGWVTPGQPASSESLTAPSEKGERWCRWRPGLPEGSPERRRPKRGARLPSSPSVNAIKLLFNHKFALFASIEESSHMISENNRYLRQEPSDSWQFWNKSACRGASGSSPPSAATGSGRRGEAAFSQVTTTKRREQPLTQR